VKFQAILHDKLGQLFPSITFVRSSVVGMLVILRRDGDADDNEYTIVVKKSRIYDDDAPYAEIPTGILYEGNFEGAVATKLSDTIGVQINDSNIIDLSGLAFNENMGNHMKVCVADSDENMHVFVYRASVSHAQLATFQNKLTGDVTPGQAFALKVVPLKNIWKETNDAKLLSTIYLYNILNSNGTI